MIEAVAWVGAVAIFAWAAFDYYYNDKKVVTCRTCQKQIFVEDADLVAHSVSGAYTKINFYHCKKCWR